jgi:hypothetical protein
MSTGNTVATFTAAPGLLVNRAYKVRVAASAASAAGVSMAAPYAMATGFMTVTPPSPVVQNESGSALEVDYCIMQSPNPTASGTSGSSLTMYGRIYEVLNGTQITGSGSPDAAITSQFGYAPANADGSPMFNPEYEAGWVWANADFNQSFGNDDEYQYTLTLPAVGVYNFTYRFSVDGGASWTFCDDGGAGSNAGLPPFGLDQLATLTVN